jgi:hypothetical protein
MIRLLKIEINKIAIQIFKMLKTNLFFRRANSKKRKQIKSIVGIKSKFQYSLR